jgi:tetratricopeptide (TPR) repeat protein
MTGAEVAIIVAKLKPELIGYAITKTLDILLKICFEQQANYEKTLNYHTKLLEQIQRDVELLSASYYRAGSDHLEDAARAVREKLRGELILEAAKKFTQAAHINPHTLPRVRAQELIGLCYLLLDEQPLALRWFEKAYQTAATAATELSRKVQDAHWPDMGRFEYQRKSAYDEAAPKLEVLYAHMRPLSKLLTSMSSGIEVKPAKSLKVPDFVEDPPSSSSGMSDIRTNVEIRDSFLEAWWR